MCGPAQGPGRRRVRHRSGRREDNPFTLRDGQRPWVRRAVPPSCVPSCCVPLGSDCIQIGLICHAPANRCVCSGTAAWPLGIRWAIRLTTRPDTMSRPRAMGIVLWLRTPRARSFRPALRCRRRSRPHLYAIAGCYRREFLEPACGAGLPAREPGLGWAGRSVEVDPALRITRTGWCWFASWVAICRGSVPAAWRRYRRRGSRHSRRGVPGTARCAGR
jgi:hypothetical protein